MIYNATQIIGKTLFAKQPIQIKRYAADSAPVVYTVSPGGSVGVVESYVNPLPGRNANLYWQFKDQNGRAYYAQHVTGAFSESAIKEQGAQTTKDLIQQQQNQDKPTSEKIMELVKWIVIVGGIFYVGSTVIKTQSRKNAYT